MFSFLYEALIVKLMLDLLPTLAFTEGFDIARSILFGQRRFSKFLALLARVIAVNREVWKNYEHLKNFVSILLLKRRRFL